MADYLEDEVDEKYYIDNEKAQELIRKLIISGELTKAEQTDRQTDRQTIDLTINEPEVITVANCIKARYDAGIVNFKRDGSGVIEKWK
jgi:hypothetical protein